MGTHGITVGNKLRILGFLALPLVRCLGREGERRDDLSERCEGLVDIGTFFQPLPSSTSRVGTF